VSRAEHAYTFDDLTVHLVVPDGVTAPRFVDVKRGDEVVRCRHAGVRNLRAPAKRSPRQASPLVKIPEDWAPPAHEVEQARVKAPSVNVEFETAQFVDWAISKGEARADWLAAWRRWVRMTHQRNVERGWKPSRASIAVGETPEQTWCREHGDRGRVQGEEGRPGMGRDDQEAGSGGVSAAMSQAAHVLAAMSAAPWVSAGLEAVKERSAALARIDAEMVKRPESTAAALDALASWLESGGTVWELRVWADAMYEGALQRGRRATFRP